MIYEGGVLKRILVDGGYIEGGAYYFYLTDHLGNNRVVANASGGIVQTSHYYPFGMSFAEGVTSSGQPYKYNGKELDTERGLNLYDYSARLMDPALGRFSTMDPLAEDYYDASPYLYCGNKPIINIDPNGEDYWTTNNPEEIKRFLESQQYGSRSIVESFDFNSWTHVSDTEFIENLTFNDETNTFHLSYGTVQNGEPTVIGMSIKAAHVWDGGASIDGARGIWYRKASGRVDNVSPEFAIIAGGTKAGWGILKWLWNTLTTNNVSTTNTFNANAARNIATKGLKETRKFGYSHGQKVYEYEGKYYSKDIDSHNGGVWKVFEEVNGKLKRIGTADKNLNMFKK